MAWAEDYISIPQLAAYVGVDDNADDNEFQPIITAASRAINKRCNRQFGRLTVPAARVYRRPAVYDVVTGLWLVEVDDVQDVTGMTVGGVPYADSGAVLLPDNAPTDGVPWERLGFADRPTSPLVAVAVWGWTAVPLQVLTATKLQCARWFARRGSPLGVAGSPDQGSELRLLAKLDPDVSTSLAGLSRRRRAG